MASPNVPVAVGDIVEMIQWCLNPKLQASENVLYYQFTALAGPPLSLAGWITVYEALLQPLFAPLLESTCTVLELTAKRIFPLPVSITVTDTNGGTPGTAGAGELPGQTCGLVKKLTNFSGRKGRGRMYSPFPSIASNTAAGKPTAAYRTALDTLAAELFTPTILTLGGASATITPGLWNKKLPPALLNFTPITGWEVDLSWATQRRRGDFGRPNTAP